MTSTIRVSDFVSNFAYAAVNLDRVASYFMNGGPIAGNSIFDASNPCPSTVQKQITEAANPNNHTNTQLSTTQSNHSPVIETSVSSAPESQYQPMVSHQWIQQPAHERRINAMINVPQYKHTTYYPHALCTISPDQEWATAE